MPKRRCNTTVSYQWLTSALLLASSIVNIAALSSPARALSLAAVSRSSANWHLLDRALTSDLRPNSSFVQYS